MIEKKDKGNISCLEKPETYTIQVKKEEKKKIKSCLEDVMEVDKYDEKSENLYKDLLTRNRKNMGIIRRYRKDMQRKWKGASMKTILRQGNTSTK